ncbi:TraB/GumN family protein [Rhizorhabdus phycosphaerae]|uniref:TraB/GumN family protein n=1 Tax=Rhizorhabdus phycosphaerae TaxID=2711156 RepID=UPI001D00DECF|nr:TraB/GumN family protein [Rhizorhabdus phycosphaerae]
MIDMKLFRRAVSALLALLIASPAAAAPALWKFGDADTTVYLFGTIHALPPGYAWEDERIRKAMDASDTLVIETLVDKDPRAMAALFPPPDSSLPPIVERVTPEARPAFETLLAKAKVDPAMLSRMPTWQACFVLMGAMMRDLGVQREAGVEDGLTSAFAAPVASAAPVEGGQSSTLPASAATKKIEGLETVADQLAMFSTLSEADQREMLTSFATGKSSARSDYDRLLKAWSTGDEAGIARMFDEDEDLTPHLREILLRKRNANWAAWLKQRLEKPGTVFVAVGAGHLAGPLSVQKMLAAEGIAVEKVDAAKPGNR